MCIPNVCTLPHPHHGLLVALILCTLCAVGCYSRRGEVLMSTPRTRQLCAALAPTRRSEGRCPHGNSPSMGRTQNGRLADVQDAPWQHQDPPHRYHRAITSYLIA